MVAFVPFVPYASAETQLHLYMFHPDVLSGRPNYALKLLFLAYFVKSIAIGWLLVSNEYK